MAISDGLVAVMERTLADVFPVAAGIARMELVARDDGGLTTIDPWGNLRVTARLIYWDGPEGQDRSITNICEQELVVLDAEGEPPVPPERHEAFVRGWALALAHYLGAMPEDWFVMPCDLFFRRVLRLKRPRTAADFERAFMAPSRLGRFLAEDA